MRPRPGSRTTKLGHGREASVAFLKENPDVCAEICARAREAHRAGIAAKEAGTEEIKEPKGSED